MTLAVSSFTFCVETTVSIVPNFGIVIAYDMENHYVTVKLSMSKVKVTVTLPLIFLVAR